MKVLGPIDLHIEYPGDWQCWYQAFLRAGLINPDISISEFRLIVSMTELPRIELQHDAIMSQKIEDQNPETLERFRRVARGEEDLVKPVTRWRVETSETPPPPAVNALPEKGSPWIGQVTRIEPVTPRWEQRGQQVDIEPVIYNTTSKDLGHPYIYGCDCRMCKPIHEQVDKIAAAQKRRPLDVASDVRAAVDLEGRAAWSDDDLQEERRAAWKKLEIPEAEGWTPRIPVAGYGPPPPHGASWKKAFKDELEALGREQSDAELPKIGTVFCPYCGKDHPGKDCPTHKP